MTPPLLQAVCPRYVRVALVALLAGPAAGCGATPEQPDPVTANVRTLQRSGPTATTQRLARTPLATAEPVGDGYVLPYSTQRVISDFWECRGRRRHRGIDLAGVGTDSGLGSSVVSMAPARITHIGTPELNASRYGRRLRTEGTTERGGASLPTRGQVPGYGEVYYFTRNHGTWRTGVVVSTEVLSGPLAGHRVRYMHLAAVRPDLAEGDEVGAGEEIGIMGGTAVLRASPHVHVDAEDESGQRVDLGPFLGLSRPDPVPDC